MGGVPVYVYVEFYDLTPVDGKTSYRIEVSLESAEPGGNPIWRFLTALGRRQDNEGAVAFQVEDVGTTSTASWYSSIDTADLTSGGYILRMSVTDLAMGSTAEQKIRFDLKDEE